MTNRRLIKFHFFDNPGIGGSLIKWRLGSTVSHVGMEFEDDEFWHSTFTTGVISDRNYLKSHASVDSVEVWVTNEGYEKALKYIRSNQNKKYDFTAILGFFVGRKVQNDDAFFCSEIGRGVFEEATGHRLKWPKLCAPHELRIMAEMYMLLSAKD
ncbi:hypothetical protein [Vibrio phage BONAISHI]|nr:hypothetical protein [Vibrio phage BONAISHI]